MMIDFDILWPKWGIKPHGIVHLGANTGQESDIYQKHGVKEVVWVEAIPAVFGELLHHVAHIEGNHCINACVGDEEGKEVQFHISNNQAQSSSYLELGEHLNIHKDVHYVSSFKTTMRRMDVLLKDFKIEGDWFLNADLQGAELPAFKGMGELLHKFKWIYSEVNAKETYLKGALVGELDEYLSKFGFKRVETGTWVGGCWTDALYIKDGN